MYINDTAEHQYPDRRRIKIKLEYDGTDFHGWQRQPNVRTVQEDVEKALTSVLSEKITVIGAGRTDAGVHAAGQAAHFSTDNSLDTVNIINGANSLLKKDLRVWDIEEVPTSFHARFNAVSRCYRYQLLKRDYPLKRRYAWFPDCSWDDGVIREAVCLLAGEHSFKSFSHARPDEEEYICNVVEATWEYDEEGSVFTIIADRFMHKMVRGIVGALIDVGRGFMPLEEFRRLLEEPENNGATRVAQPQGLTLVEVKY